MFIAIRRIFLFLLLVVLLPGPLAAADLPRFDEVVIANSRSEVLLYFTLADAVTAEMEQGLKSGLPLVLTFFVEIQRRHDSGEARLLRRLQFEQQLSYDSLKDEYRVSREGLDYRPQITSSLAEARRLFTSIYGLAVLPLAELSPEQDYRLRLKAQMAEKSQPWSLNRLLPFRRLWGFETPWHEEDFRY